MSDAACTEVGCTIGSRDQRVSISANAAKQPIKNDYQVGVETMPAGTQK